MVVFILFPLYRMLFKFRLEAATDKQAGCLNECTRADSILQARELNVLFIPVRMEQPLKSFHDQFALCALRLF